MRSECDERPALRHARRVPFHCSSSLRDACPRTPEVKRTAVRVHAVAMRGRLLSALQRFLLLLPFRRSGTNSVNVIHVCAGICVQRMTRLTHQTCCRKTCCEGGSSLPACLSTRPQQGSTRTGWPTNSAMPSEILQCSGRTRDPEWNEKKSSKGRAGFGGDTEEVI